MIAICGDLTPHARRDGLATAIAQRAAHAEADVQVVGIVPDGADGDALLLRIAASGVGHAAVLRTAGRPLESADLELALRYLPDIRVVVASEMAPASLHAVVEGAAFLGAALVVVQSSAAAPTVDPSLPDSAIVLAAPATDPDGTFAGFVATLATRLDAGEGVADAWSATVRSLAVDSISRDRAPARRGSVAAQ